MAVGDSFGQLSSLLIAEDAARRQGVQSALANLLSVGQNLGARRQQQSQFDAGLRATESARALDDAYRREALAASSSQFGSARSDRNAQNLLDEQYRRDALKQNNELARLQIAAQNEAYNRAATTQRDNELNTYFSNALRSEQAGVDTAPEILSILKPEHRSQIDQLRLAQNQELGQLNTAAAAAADRMNSALRGVVGPFEKAVQDQQARLSTLPDSNWFFGLGENKTEGQVKLQTLQDALIAERERQVNNLFKSNRGLDQLATFDSASGRFVPLLKPLRRVATPLSVPAAAQSVPTVQGMGNLRVAEAAMEAPLLLATDAGPASAPPLTRPEVPLFLATDSPPATTQDRVPMSWLQAPREVLELLPTDAGPAPSPQANMAPLSGVLNPRQVDPEVQVAGFVVRESVANAALQEYNRILQATGDPSAAREASRRMLSAGQNMELSPAARPLGGFPILTAP